MMKTSKGKGTTTLALACFFASALSCTNVLVTPGASKDGTALIGDNDDSSGRHGLVTHFDGGNHKPGSMRQIWDFEQGKYLGEIPQPAQTFSTISHANEKGVVVAETTHGGLSKLKGSGMLDYGSLIVTTLQRASTAREAIHTIANLTSKYGYSSAMEGFSITDGTEVWYMELIGKGDFGEGIVWVALRVPDGYVTAHANQARITKFVSACVNPNACLASPDAVTFAIEHGLFNGKPGHGQYFFVMGSKYVWL
jgi:dipeptidase